MISKNIRYLVAGVCFYSASSVLMAADWQQVVNESGITLSQRSLPGKVYKEIKGEMIMKGQIAALTRVLNDPALCAKWLNNCRFSKMVRQVNPAERISYTVIDAPFLLEDRDLYVRSRANYNSNTKAITIFLQSVPDHAPAEKQRVRVRAMNGFWRFQQIDPQQVKVNYQMYSDPQVTPVNAVDATTPKGLLNTFSRLRALAGSPALKNTQFKPGELEAITR